MRLCAAASERRRPQQRTRKPEVQRKRATLHQPGRETGGSPHIHICNRQSKSKSLSPTPPLFKRPLTCCGCALSQRSPRCATKLKLSFLCARPAAEGFSPRCWEPRNARQGTTSRATCFPIPFNAPMCQMTHMPHLLFIHAMAWRGAHATTAAIQLWMGKVNGLPCK